MYQRQLCAGCATQTAKRASGCQVNEQRHIGSRESTGVSRFVAGGGRARQLRGASHERVKNRMAVKAMGHAIMRQREGMQQLLAC